MSGMKREHYKKIGQWLPTVMALRAEKEKKLLEMGKKIEYPKTGDLSR